MFNMGSADFWLERDSPVCVYGDRWMCPVLLVLVLGNSAGYLFYYFSSLHAYMSCYSQ